MRLAREMVMPASFFVAIAACLKNLADPAFEPWMFVIVGVVVLVNVADFRAERQRRRLAALRRRYPQPVRSPGR